MTTARSNSGSELVRKSHAGKLLWAVLVATSVSASAWAQQPPVHWLHAGAMPPGAIGRQRLMRGDPLSGFCQPVEIRAPHGARIAPAAGSDYLEGRPGKLLAGLAIGPVYRFRITEIAGQPGLELFPTIEVVDRLHPPPGQKLRFPIPVELTQTELLAAADGKFVTRIIYLEDPSLALPLEEGDYQRWVEARPGDDPLVSADTLGRPMAILRIGGRVPESTELDPAFAYGAPPVQVFEQPQPLPHYDPHVQP